MGSIKDSNGELINKSFNRSSPASSLEGVNRQTISVPQPLELCSDVVVSRVLLRPSSSANTCPSTCHQAKPDKPVSLICALRPWSSRPSFAQESFEGRDHIRSRFRHISWLLCSPDVTEWLLASPLNLKSCLNIGLGVGSGSSRCFEEVGKEVGNCTFSNG